MRWVHALVATMVAGALTGCPAAGDDDDAGDDDTLVDDDTALPEIAIWKTEPEEGAEDAYHGDEVFVWFSDVVSGADLVLVEDATGAVVPGQTASAETSPMGSTAVHTRLAFDPYGADPSVHLTPSTAYTAIATLPGYAPFAFGFTTSEIGAPVLDPLAEIEGGDYEWDIYSGSFLEPVEGTMIEPLLFGLSTYGVHVADLDVAAGHVEVFAASLDWGGGHLEQDWCEPTIELHGAADSTLSNPSFTVGPLDVDIGGGYGQYGLLDGMVVAGSFAADGTSYTGGSLKGVVYTQPLDPLVGDGSEGSACVSFASFGIDCEACPDGSGPFCFEVWGRGLQGQRIDVWGNDPETGAAVQGITEVTQAMVDAWTVAGHCP